MGSALRAPLGKLPSTPGDALRRRFIGVVGIASNIMRAIVEVVQGNPITLRLKLHNAKLAPDSSEASRAKLGGQDPITNAAVDQAAGNQVVVENITKEQLQSINITAPTLSDGDYTGKVVHLKMDESST